MIKMSDLFTEVNNIKICYEVNGKGYPIILVHGFAMYKEFWIAQKPLSEQFKVITLDNRGCGKSDHPTETFDMETLAKDIKDLMDFLKIEKAHIIGHSLGGMIAQNFALEHPNRVNKLILIATFPNLPLNKSGLEMYKKSQIEAYEAKLKDPIKAFNNKMKQRFTRNFYKLMVQEPSSKFHGLFSTEDLMENEKNKGTSKTQDIINQINAISKHNTLEQLHNIKHNTLILAGEKDRIISKISSNEMHSKIPNNTLKVFSGSHYFPLEEAPEVNNIILNFLNE
jgi:proline-specific peptidase